MRALVLNLALARERLAFMADQLDRLGLEWERIDAVSPETLTPPKENAVWNRWERPLRETEMAACASHIEAWTRIAETDRPGLVLEDDALLDRGLPELLARIDAGALDFDHISLETKGRKKLLSRGTEPGLDLRRLYLDRTGAAAYVLSPGGARKLMARVRRARGLADGVICAAYELTSFQADPALAIQLEHGAKFGLTPPRFAASQIETVEKPGKGGRLFRLRRARSLLLQGLRQLRPGTQMRLVAPACNWIIDAGDRADTTDGP